MSYGRDPDRKIRGVGAIASVDAVRRRAPRRAFRAMGADTPPQGCSVFSNGSWYVRTPDGRARKVDDKEAAGYPSCDTTVTPTGVRPSPTRPRYDARATAVYTTTPRATTVRPGGGGPMPSSATPVGPAGAPSSSSDSSAGAKKPGSPTGSSRNGTKTPAPGKGASGSGKASSGGGSTSSSKSNTTAPAWTPAPSVSTQWLTPAAATAEVPELPDLTTPKPPTMVDQMKAGATKHKGILMVGAGIGLLLLLTRD